MQDILNTLSIDPTEENKEWLEELKKKFPFRDYAYQASKCVLWWKEGNKKLKRPRLAFMNWLEKTEVDLEIMRNDPELKQNQSKLLGMVRDIVAKKKIK